MYNNKLADNIDEISDTVVRKYGQCSMIETIRFMDKLCNYLIAHPDHTIVPVYDFYSHGRKENGIYHYTYDMEKLYRLSSDEKRIINSKNHGESVITGRKNYPKLIEFLEDIIKLGRYTDLHSGNIMIDMDGQYRLIDLEGFYHSPLDHDKNMWFQCESS